MSRKCAKRDRKQQQFVPGWIRNHPRKQRSLIEQRFFQLLQELGSDWKWEPWKIKVQLKNGYVARITPDCYSRELGLFIEITERKRRRKKTIRAEAMARSYPEPLIIFFKDELEVLLASPSALAERLKVAVVERADTVLANAA